MLFLFTFHRLLRSCWTTCLLTVKKTCHLSSVTQNEPGFLATHNLKINYCTKWLCNNKNFDACSPSEHAVSPGLLHIFQGTAKTFNIQLPWVNFSQEGNFESSADMTPGFYYETVANLHISLQSSGNWSAVTYYFNTHLLLHCCSLCASVAITLFAFINYYYYYTYVPIQAPIWLLKK